MPRIKVPKPNDPLYRWQPFGDINGHVCIYEGGRVIALVPAGLPDRDKVAQRVVDALNKSLIKPAPTHPAGWGHASNAW